MDRSPLCESSQIQYFQRLSYRKLKALKPSAFFHALVFFSICGWLPLIAVSAVANTQCQAQKFDITATVRSVVDGDTLRLSDGNLVRFIGVNAPEIDHEGSQSQPFSKQSRDFLRQLAPAKSRIGLVYGQERKDRHKRQLAHIFTIDGANIQQALLQKGLAAWIVVPPNLAFANCYRYAERQARTKNIGIWARDLYRPIQAKTVDQFKRGFQYIHGRINTIDRNGAWYLLKFTNKLALRVHTDKLKYFPDNSIHHYKNKTVTVRGWLYQKQGLWRMTVKHPAALEVDI